MNKEKIIDSYRRYFYVTYAYNEELRKKSYRVRYEVFCKEFNYWHCPNQLEQDEYDSRSRHCLLMHKPSGTAAGCVRLIMPLEDSNASFPFEICCGDAVDKNKFDLSTINNTSYGEISRLAVLSTFRRRNTDDKKPISFPDKEKLIESGRESFPLISVSLSLGILAMLLNSGLKYGVAMMEPRLTRMLSRIGIVFKQIGNVVDYHGRRGPFLISREDILSNLTPEFEPLMKLIDVELTRKH
jgi:N-acyl amino acid synthase of PEP-CTERM/exosortase system